ncbi:MAG: extracellular solute-binding protein [Gammaproteobacteria bacterium]|nr:extracellular solute-binding protein [Gammaproteobacteria bacterium]NNF61075.1 extracellular solute-binding protein [Gammaproteobacteria bacterium]
MPIRLLLLLPVWLAAACAPSAEQVVVYSSRAEQLIQPLLERYAAESGVRISWITDKEGPLMQRLIAEGDQTPADLLLTVDAGNLWLAAEEGLLQPAGSTLLEKNIPAHLRDADGRWFGLSVRARTVAYSTERVDPQQLGSYAGLAEPKWRGRLCLRTAKKVYNQSLVAMMIAEHGEPKTEQIVRGWVANLAAPVFSSDTRLLEAIVAGQCDVGIVNTYYYGRLQKQNPQIPLALYWPDQDGSGVHVNVSGAGVVRHSDNPQAAVALLEWLSSAEAQKEFAAINLEYPANSAVSPDPLVAQWGSFRQNVINVSRAGELQAASVRLMERAGYR